MQSNVEQWMPVVGYEGLYEVSNWGRVKSLERRAPVSGRPIRERILKPSNRNGYSRVNLSKDGVATDCHVHRLVAAAFIGPVPSGLIVCHRSANRADNRLVNLRYGTYSKNNGLDRVRDGTVIRGEDVASARLTESQVRELRQRLAAGERRFMRRQAREWGVHKDTVFKAAHGTNWAWL